MAEIKGTPAVHIGPSSTSCDSRDLSVPPVCAPCRQVGRWIERTVAWSAAGVTRFKAILTAILQEHQDILSSYCGNCALQATPSCDCMVQDYLALGLPTRVQAVALERCEQILRERITIENTCTVECLPDCINCVTITGLVTDLPTCFLRECAVVCAPCITITLDPCNDPDQLDLMTRLIEARRFQFNKLGLGENIAASLAILFPGSAPQFVAQQFGKVYFDLGRALTLYERSYLSLLLSVVPLGYGVELELVTTCP